MVTNTHKLVNCYPKLQYLSWFFKTLTIPVKSTDTKDNLDTTRNGRLGLLVVSSGWYSGESGCRKFQEFFKNVEDIRGFINLAVGEH